MRAWGRALLPAVLLLIVFGCLAAATGSANEPSYATACLKIEDGQIRGTTCEPCSPDQHSVDLDRTLCPVTGRP